MQFLKAEPAAFGDGERGAHPVEVAAPPPRDLRCALEIPFAVGAQSRAHLVERPLVPQGDEHVVHGAVAGAGVVHVVRHHPRHVECAGDVDQARRRLALLGQAVIPALDGNAAVEGILQRCGRFACRVRLASCRE